MEYDKEKENIIENDRFTQIGVLTSRDYRVIEFGIDKRSRQQIDTIQNKRSLEIIQVCCSNQYMAFIDYNRHLWLINHQQGYDQEPLNLSVLLNKKVQEVFLAQDEMIIKCLKKDYLLYLKSNNQPPPSFALNKVSNNKYNSLLEKYTIYQLQQQYDKYYLSFSEIKQKGVFNLAYKSKKLKNLDNGKQYLFDGQIMGLSFSKYHSMCWDSLGKIYSWGLRSSWITQTTQLIFQPKIVNSLSEQFIFSGLADEYYSLALNRNGQLIQWGLKNKTSIFPHRRVRGKYILQKMITIKGVNKIYACMGISGKIYLWGSGTDTFGIHGNKDFPVVCNKLSNKYISDFDISKDSIIIIVSQTSQLLRRFKSLQLSGIKADFKKLFRHPAQTNSVKILNYVKQAKPRLKTQISQNLFQTCQTTCLTTGDQPEQVIAYIDSRPKQTKRQYKPSVTTYYNKSIENNISAMFDLKQKRNILIDKINTKINVIKTSAKSARSQINHLIKNNPIKIKPFKIQGFRDQKVLQKIQSSRKHTSPYDYRLKLVTQRKYQLDTLRISTLTQNTFQSRKIKKQILMKNKKCELLKVVVSALMRDWVCQIMSKPIIGAKLIIVQQFRNSLAFELRVRRLQSVFFRKYLHNRIQALPPSNKKAILRFLQNTKEKLKKRRQVKLAKDIQTYSAIFNIKKKVSHMIMLYTFTIKKYQKLSKWLKQVKTKKLLALRIKWNLNLINSNIIQFKQQRLYSEFKNQQFDELEVNDIYQNFINQKPQLKLTAFTQKHPIFRINFNITKKIDVRLMPLPKEQILKINKKSSIVAKIMKRSKVSKIFEGKKMESKDHQFERLKIMPYSQDYDQLIFSRKYNLKIPQNVLKMARWTQFQSLLLEKLLQHLIKLNRKAYFKDLFKYEIQMANFIQINYQKIRNCRAQYLLIPLLIPPPLCNKMKRQLDRMIVRADKKYLLKQHMMQDRHVILDIALKLQNCPVKPMLTDNLSKTVFKQYFLVYVTKLSKAARQFNIKSTSKLGEICKFD